MRNVAIAFGLALTLVAAGACGDDDDDTTPVGTGGFDGGAGNAGRGGSSGRGGSGAGGSGGSAGQNGGRGGSAADAGGVLSDAQIAQIVLNANAGEAEQGMVALTSAQRAEVRDFARMMVTDHGAAVTRENDLFLMIKLTPAASSVATELKSMSDDTVRQLKSATPAMFDRFYMQAQVEAHEQVLDLIEDRLLKDAKGAELRAELDALRGDVQRHLKNATDLLASLAIDMDGGAEDAGR